jgi:hypothetical protein
MLRRVLIGAALACMLGGIAYAADDEAPPAPAEGDDQCSAQLAKTEEALETKREANAISEDDSRKVYDLLDTADGQCTEGNIAGATATLATANGIVAKAK